MLRNVPPRGTPLAAAEPDPIGTRLPLATRWWQQRSALSSSSQMVRSRRRRLTAPASAPPRSATPAWSARTTSSAHKRRDSFSHPAAPAQNRTETNQHRVSCSMVDKMDVQDSAQRITSPRSQHTASSTGDSLQLSMRSAMCAVCPTFSTSARSRITTCASGRVCTPPPGSARLSAPRT